MHPLTDVFTLAHRRYPGVDGALAVMYFMSDRRAAGLGALDERKRVFKGQTVVCVKTRSLLDGTVLYTTRVHRLGGREQPEFVPYPVSIDCPANETIQLKRVAPVDVCLCIKVDQHEFADQWGRRNVAKALKELRRRRFAAVARLPLTDDEGDG